MHRQNHDATRYADLPAPAHDLLPCRLDRKHSMMKRNTRSSRLLFVVQEHHGSGHHFELRLEIDGEMKTWSIPKTPSMEPGAKRAAVEVGAAGDDGFAHHAFFGQTWVYGSDIASVWDQGVWEPECDAQDAYCRGRIEFTMSGNRLHGRWVLTRTGLSGWVLRKRRDEFGGIGIAVHPEKFKAVESCEYAS